MSTRTRRAVAGLLVSLTLAGLAACAQPAVAEPAPSASDPVCAVLLLDLPDQLVDQQRRSTTSQASRAWGDPPIVLRCGVTPLGPTTDPCLSIPDPDGENAIDWVAVGTTDRGRTFATYGRVPAVEITIPDDYPGDAVLAELAAAVAEIPQDGQCL